LHRIKKEYGTTDLTDTEHGQARARALLGRGARRPGHAGLDALSFYLTVYVKEQGSDRGSMDAAAATGQHRIREPKNGGKIAGNEGVLPLTIHDN